MDRTLVINDDELALMDELLHAELDSAYSELRRTRNPSYRGQVEKRRDLIKHLLEAVNRSRQTQAVTSLA
ncbi:MAG: hypothetical protein GX591_06180 [Planctomycetes bacterium]|mgnify:FL=1|nr:hypothetical protein [Planctomycetota bacterium]